MSYQLKLVNGCIYSLVVVLPFIFPVVGMDIRGVKNHTTKDGLYEITGSLSAVLATFSYLMSIDYCLVFNNSDMFIDLSRLSAPLCRASNRGLSDPL